MLVISRKISESVLIGDNIEIVISEISGDRVKICINAPKEIPVVRRELLETRNLNKEAAASPNRALLEQLKTKIK